MIPGVTGRIWESEDGAVTIDLEMVQAICRNYSWQPRPDDGWVYTVFFGQLRAEIDMMEMHIDGEKGLQKAWKRYRGME